MTARARTQLLVLAALILAIALIMFVRSDNGPAESFGQPSNSTRGGGSAERVDAPVVDLKLDRLTAQREDPGEPERNPFRFRPAPPPPAPRVEPGPAPRPEIFVPPPPAGPPPPPPIPLKYFGNAMVQGTRIGYFADARGRIIHGKEGDIIEGRYRVVRVGEDSADLQYADGRGRQTIRLSGQ